MDTLIAKIGAGFIRSYILAGLLPAAVPVLGWLIYTRGHDFAPTTFDAHTLPQFGPLLLCWIVLGIVFFAIRQPILAAFQALPSGRIGRWLLNRALRRRFRLERARDTLAWRYTVARWPESSFEIDRAEFRLSWVDVPALAKALTDARTSRAAFAALPEGPLRDSDRRKIIQGLSALYLGAGSKPQSEPDKTALATELAAWRNLPAGAATWFADVASAIQREWSTAELRLDSLPKGIWLHSTDLGNRLAALDDYAKERYGIETTTLWTRLWWSLPDASKDDVSSAKLNVEICVNFAVALVSLAAVPFVTGTPVCPAWTMFGCRADIPIWAASSLAFAYMAYRGAVGAVANLSMNMQTLIDMHRLRVLAAFGLRPTNAADEMTFFGELQDFLLQAAQRDQTRALQVDFNWSADADKQGKSSA